MTALTTPMSTSTPTTAAQLLPGDSLQLYEELYASFSLLANSTSSMNGSELPTTTEDIGPGCYSGLEELGPVITMVLYAVVCLVGLFGNTLVIYVVLCFTKMQTVTNMYILNLAVADECFLIGIPFLLYTMRKGSWEFGDYACKAYMMSTSITQFTSSIFLLIMSADRYLAVCHPITSPRYRTLFVAKLVCVGAWLTSALLMLPVILFANTVQNGEHFSCNIKWPESHGTHSATSFILYTLLLGFATPLSFIMVFYCLVIRKLHIVGLKHKSKDKRRSHRRVTRLVLTVITVYVLCWLPYWVAQLVIITTPPPPPTLTGNSCISKLELFGFLLVGCLSYSNSAINPLLYAFLSDNFKKSFVKAFTCTASNEMNVQQQLERNMLPRWLKSSRNVTRETVGSYTAVGTRRLPMQLLNQSMATITLHATGTSTCYGTGQTATTSLVEPCPETTITNATTAANETLLKPLGKEGSHRPPVLHTDL